MSNQFPSLSASTIGDRWRERRDRDSGYPRKTATVVMNAAAIPTSSRADAGATAPPRPAFPRHDMFRMQQSGDEVKNGRRIIFSPRSSPERPPHFRDVEPSSRPLRARLVEYCDQAEPRRLFPAGRPDDGHETVGGNREIEGAKSSGTPPAWTSWIPRAARHVSAPGEGPPHRLCDNPEPRRWDEGRQF